MPARGAPVLKLKAAARAPPCRSKFPVSTSQELEIEACSADLYEAYGEALVRSSRLLPIIATASAPTRHEPPIHIPCAGELDQPARAPIFEKAHNCRPSDLPVEQMPLRPARATPQLPRTRGVRYPSWLSPISNEDPPCGWQDTTRRHLESRHDGSYTFRSPARHRFLAFRVSAKRPQPTADCSRVTLGPYRLDLSRMCDADARAELPPFRRNTCGFECYVATKRKLTPTLGRRHQG